MVSKTGHLYLRFRFWHCLLWVVSQGCRQCIFWWSLARAILSLQNQRHHSWMIICGISRVFPGDRRWTRSISSFVRFSTKALFPWRVHQLSFIRTHRRDYISTLAFCTWSRACCCRRRGDLKWPWWQIADSCYGKRHYSCRGTWTNWLSRKASISCRMDSLHTDMSYHHPIQL